MAGAPLGVVLQQLRRLIGSRTADWSDHDLLQRFVAQRDQDAFAMLMERHSPLVWSVCRRLLNDSHDAEDAYQAAFLILVRKAASIRRQACLASWLYRVTFRVALHAQRRANGRRTEEREVDSMPAPEASPDLHWDEIRPVLDEEVNCLPEKYRAPIVLCYLQGKTNEDAARRLGWTKGTVSGRLARARDILRKRLSRRGVTLSAGALAAVVTEKAGAAAVPTALFQTTLRAATLIAAGQTLAAGAISASAATLVKGVMQEMFASKLKMMALTVLCIGIMGTGTGAVLVWGYGDEPKTDKPPSAAKSADPQTVSSDSKPEPNKSDLQKLQGTWRVVELEMDGNKIDSEALGGGKPLLKLTFTGDKLSFEVAKEAREGAYSPLAGTFQLDETQKPKTIDVTRDGEPNRRLADIVLFSIRTNDGRRLGIGLRHGIYRLEEDRLTICTGRERPSEFTTWRASNVIVFMLKRDSANKEEKPAGPIQGRLVDLAKAKRDVARGMLAARMEQFKTGHWDYGLVFEAARMLKDSELDVAANKTQRL